MIAVFSFFPFYYLFKSRLKSRYEQFSWMLIYVIPVFYLVLSFSEIPLLPLLCLYLVTLASLFSIYETGYLENDLITILNENKPTLRTSETERRILSSHYFLISFTKTCVALGLVAVIVICAQFFELSVYVDQFIVCLVFMRLVFYVHNSYRTKLNMLTFILLCTLKYTSPILLFIPISESAFVLTLAFFMFPLLRILEHASRERYAFKRIRSILGNHDLFRVKYYSLCLLVVIPLVIYGNYGYTPLIIFGYFFLARLSGYILVRMKSREIAEFREQQRNHPY